LKLLQRLYYIADVSTPTRGLVRTLIKIQRLSR